MKVKLLMCSILMAIELSKFGMFEAALLGSEYAKDFCVATEVTWESLCDDSLDVLDGAKDLIIKLQEKQEK